MAEAANPQTIEPRLSSRRTGSLLSCCLPAKVDTEEGLGESVLPQHALQGSGGTPCRQARVGQAHDAIKLCVDKIGARLILAQAKLLVGDLNALDLGMEVKTQDSDYPDWTSLLQTLSPKTSCSSPLKSPPDLDKSGRSHIVFQESALRVLSCPWPAPLSSAELMFLKENGHSQRVLHRFPDT